MRIVLTILTSLIAAAAPLAAQHRPEPLYSPLADPVQRSVRIEQGPVVPSVVVGGILGGGAGLLVGAFAFAYPLAVALPATDDDLSTPGIIMGLQLGQALGIPVGSHLANSRRGELGKSLLASVAIGALASALMWTGDFDAAFESTKNQVILVATPVAQLLTSLHFERSGDDR